MANTLEIINQLSEVYEFRVSDAPENKTVKIIEFKDGRKYRFEFPLFDAFHDAFTVEGNVETSLLKLGLSCLRPENQKSPIINTDYLNSHMLEGINLWSPLLRGLLYRPPA